MTKKSLASFFEEFLDKESLFTDRGALLSSYNPETIYHRDKEVNQARILKITGQNFTNLINDLQKIHESAEDHTETVVAVLKGSTNIKKHLDFLFKNAKKEILFSFNKEKDKYLKILEDTKKNKKDINIKIQPTGARLCLVDNDNVVIFPVDEGDTHPDYDFGIWIKNKQTTKFLKQLLSSA